jgi:hypothetical protein
LDKAIENYLPGMKHSQALLKAGYSESVAKA